MDVKKLKKLLSNYKYYDTWLLGKQVELSEVNRKLYSVKNKDLDELPHTIKPAAWEAGIKITELINEKESLELHIDQLNKSKIFINNILNTVSEVERDIIKLHYIEGMPWKLVALEVGYSEGSCRRHRNNAFEKIICYSVE